MGFFVCLFVLFCFVFVLFFWGGLPIVSNEKQGIVSSVKRAQRPRRLVWMNIRKRWRHTVVTETLKVETTSLYWILALTESELECLELKGCAAMPVFAENKLGCMLLHSLTLIQSDVTATIRERNRLFGLVAKASASRAEDPGFDSRLRRDLFGVESYQ